MSGKYPGGFVQLGAPAGFSVAFDGTGDFLNVADNAAFELTGDFTIEGWFYLTNTVTTEQDLVTKWFASGNFSYLLYVLSGSLRFAWSANGSTTNSISGGTVSLNTWFHAAISGSAASGTIRLFLNGVQVATQSTVTFYTSGTSPVYIMADNNGGTPIYTRGYASNVRILKGTNLYTAAFTPPTQLLNITNTSLLTCNSPAIVDQSTANSGSGFTVTANGNAAPSTFTPFVGYTAGASGFRPALGAAAPGVWTLDEATTYQQNRQWPIYDPSFNQTTLMLHGNQPPGVTDTNNNVFKDSSSNNYTITRAGNTTQGTFSPFSPTGWSNYLNGSATSLRMAANSAFDQNAGSFSVECWVYPATIQATTGLFIYGAQSNVGLLMLAYGYTTGLFKIDQGAGGGIRITSTSTYPANAWYHVAYTYDGSTLKLFINGILQGSAANAALSARIAGPAVAIGEFGASSYFNGYVSNFRICRAAIPTTYQTASTTVGTLVFTPPTSPLTTTSQGASNVTFLTSQSNRFVDNSSSPVTITTTGTPSVQAFEPFPPDVAYTTYNVGGSGYFDRTTDYLDVGSNSNLTIGTSNFTIAMWAYFNVIDGTTQIIFEGRPSSAADNVTPTILYSSVTTAITVRVNGANLLTGTASVTKAGQWYYIVVSRLSGTSKLFVNGAEQASAADTNTYVAFAADRPRIGDRGNSSGAGTAFGGYLSGLQVLIGTGYSSVAVPTAPPTAITNTRLLLNFTNAGIIDNTAKNALETVGATQISTAQSKWGGSSMYFNGTTSYLTYPVRGADFGSGNFTIELWFYKLSTGGQRLVSARANNDGLTLGVSSSNFLSAFYGDTTASGSIAGTTTIAINTWYHVALVRSGGTATLYLNGVVEGTPTSWSAKTFTSTAYRIGTSLDSRNEYFDGYIDDLRMTTGVARYTTTFTPPTSQLQSQ